MPSVKLALDHVNEHSAVLKNYRLHMWWNDTMVSGTAFVSRELFLQAKNDQHYILHIMFSKKMYLKTYNYSNVFVFFFLFLAIK